MNYKSFDDKDYKSILDIIADSERVIYGGQISEDYSHDELGALRRMPDIVVKAKSAKEISRLMKYAFDKCIPVTPRGSGTGLVGAAVPIEGGIVLDMSAMNRILELDEENLTLTAEPGVLLMEVAAFAEANGFLYPPDPGEKTATIGGNISTNAGGMRAVKYGVTRDYVMGLEVVFPNGEIAELGGKVVKNCSGYALKDLIIGSEGTLAIITRAVLKLVPLPPKSISLLVPFPSLRNAVETVPLIIQSKVVPTAVEFLRSDAITDAEIYLGSKFPDKSADSYLLLRFDGNTAAEIEAYYDNVAQICLRQGAKDVLIMDTEERSDSVWKPRGAFLEAIKASSSDMDEVDVVVPISQVADMVEFTYLLQEKHNIRIKSFGHAGDGNLHAYILKDDLPEEQWQERLNTAMDEMYQKALSLGGQISGEHGIGSAKREYLRRALPDEVLVIMRGIKGVFDPKNILNPQKIF